MRVRLTIIFLLAYISQGICQGINNNWLMGYESFGGIPFGITKFDFNSGSPLISYDSLEMEFRHTHANISDSNGNLLFYTNGHYVADATNDTMLNGGGLNLGAYANAFSAGLQIPQGAIVIPKPSSSSNYYIFHLSIDNYPDPTGSSSYKLLKTEIDMTLNGGLGAVISKNQVVINDTLNIGKITACKHANGRDWWVVVHKANSNTFYKLLILPSVILGPYVQTIGSVRLRDDGQAKFSPDGKKYAYFCSLSAGLDILDFDRCSGLFSNWINDQISVTPGTNVGCEFSSNSNLLYVSNLYNIYQYDLLSPNITSSKIIVATWDSFFQPGSPSLHALLCFPQLAPDGKIYITTGNSTTYFGRIENPNTLGITCNVAQHSVLLPTYNFNTLPNHPNYFLECDTTLGCGCLTSLENLTDKDFTIKSSPNPTTGICKLQFPVHSIEGMIEVYDLLGNKVLEEYISPWSQFKSLDLINFPKGIYMCKLNWKDHTGNIKIIKQ